jgi:hypothetical protein
MSLGAASQLSSHSCILSQSGQSDREIMTEEVLVASNSTSQANSISERCGG